MKILFSPSEAKTAVKSQKFIDESNFIFKNLYEKRLEILNAYNDFLKTAKDAEILKLFGYKDLSECENLRQDLFTRGLIKAVLRYDGVAYKHLDYRNLDKNAQKFIDENVMIFSNLYGGILAKDLIAEYKLKQGEKIKGVNIEKFYKDNFSNEIDKWIGEDAVLDLRAGFYEKFYDIKVDFATFKFIKNGKVLSHYAKAYRGIVLKEVAKAGVKTLKELGELNLSDLRLIDIKKSGKKNEFCVEIL